MDCLHVDALRGPCIHGHYHGEPKPIKGLTITQQSDVHPNSPPNTPPSERPSRLTESRKYCPTCSDGPSFLALSHHLLRQSPSWRSLSPCHQSLLRSSKDRVFAQSRCKACISSGTSVHHILASLGIAHSQHRSGQHGYPPKHAVLLGFSITPSQVSIGAVCLPSWCRICGASSLSQQ